jgi:hypothetical protein
MKLSSNSRLVAVATELFHGGVRNVCPTEVRMDETEGVEGISFSELPQTKIP